MQGDRQPHRLHAEKARILHHPPQPVARSEVKEQGAHFGLDALIDDREDGCPAAAVARPPHRGDRTPFQRQDPHHLAEGAARVGDVHQPERAHGGVERSIGKQQRLRIHAPGRHLRHSSASRFRVHVVHHGIG